MSSATLTREEIIANELLQAKRTAYAAMGLGKDTLEMLDEQDETLRGIEDTLEANRNIVDKSMVTLRGMTWSGYLYNQCVNTKEVVLGNVLIAPPSKPAVVQSEAGQKGVNTVMPTNGSLVSCRDKDELEEISSAVAVLHKMGLDIGNQLDNQMSTMDTIAEKTDNLTENTLAVTIRASQLRDRARATKPQFGGIYQFIDTVTGKYLAVSEGRLILSSTLNRSTYFNCYVKESNLFAMQSEKTLKYVGCAMLGHIVAESTYFGTQEECYIDFKAKTTGILLIARHWGAGAWLKRPLEATIAADNGAMAAAGAAGNVASGTAGAAAALSPPSAAVSTATAPPHPYLTDTTTGIEDKAGIIEFRVVKLAAKDKVAD